MYFHPHTSHVCNLKAAVKHLQNTFHQRKNVAGRLRWLHLFFRAYPGRVLGAHASNCFSYINPYPQQHTLAPQLHRCLFAKDTDTQQLQWENTAPAPKENVEDVTERWFSCLPVIRPVIRAALMVKQKAPMLIATSWPMLKAKQVFPLWQLLVLTFSLWMCLPQVVPVHGPPVKTSHHNHCFQPFMQLQLDVLRELSRSLQPGYVALWFIPV